MIVTPDQKQLLMNLSREERLMVSDSKSDSSFEGDSVIMQQGSEATCRHDGTFCVCQT